MKLTFLLVAALATTIGTAAAQSSTRAAGTMGTNGNNSVSNGNSSNTSSSAPNNNPTTTTPNYKPASGRPGTKPKKQNAAALGKGVVVQSGGQGHNSGPDPKGKTIVAPSATTKK